NLDTDPVIRYGLEGVKGLGEAALEALERLGPYESYEDLRAKKPVNAAGLKVLAEVGALDSLYPNRAELEARLAWEAEGGHGTCRHKDLRVHGPNNLPCTFPWIDGKPIPKRCTRACRNFNPPSWAEVVAANPVEPYSDDFLLAREKDKIGIYLTRTPFDGRDPEVWAKTHTAAQLDMAQYGDYFTIGMVARVRPHKDKNGKAMGFTTITTKDGPLDVVVFNAAWEVYRKDLRPSEDLVVIKVKKTH